MQKFELFLWKYKYNCKFIYIDLIFTDNNFHFERKLHQTFDESQRRLQMKCISIQC